MNRFTAEERRRAFLARQEATRRTLARMSQPIALTEPWPRRYRLSQIARAAMIAALLAGGWLAYQTVEFHLPTSIVKALMPRL